MLEYICHAFCPCTDQCCMFSQRWRCTEIGITKRFCSMLKTLDQMKDRVKEQLNKTAKTATWTAGQVRIPNCKEYWELIAKSAFCVYNRLTTCIASIEPIIAWWLSGYWQSNALYNIGRLYLKWVVRGCDCAKRIRLRRQIYTRSRNRGDSEVKLYYRASKRLLIKAHTLYF